MFLTHWLRTRARVARPSTPRPRFRPRVEAMEDRSLPSGGLLDPTFGAAGVVSTDFGANLDYLRSVAVAGDGKVVAGGVTFQGRGNGNASDFALARYLPDGTPDGSFGTGGKVTTVVVGGSVTNNLAAVAVQTDGKVLAAGGVNDEFALVRYNLNGTIDASFGGTAKGKVLTDITSRSLDRAMAMTVQADGRILLAGATAPKNSTSYDLALMRYTAAGLLDTTFSQDGKTTLHLPASIPLTIDSMKVAIYPPAAGSLAGKVLVTTGGYAVRFNTDGGIDTSFGGGSGYVRFNGTSAALQPDGRIVTAWSSKWNGEYDVRLSRLLPDGSPDASFGVGGTTVWETSPTSEYVGSVAVQADGQILVAGRQADAGTSVYHLFVARYNPSGEIDTTFGVGGTATTGDNLFDDRPQSPINMVLQPDGRVVVAGTTLAAGNRDFAVARFLATGPQVTSFAVSPSPVTAGDPLTLTAGGVAALNPGSTVTQVAFYQDSNGDGVLDRDADLLLGYGVQTSPGTWTFTFSTAALPPGTYTFFAAPEDSYGAVGDPLALTVAVV